MGSPLVGEGKWRRARVSMAIEDLYLSQQKQDRLYLLTAKLFTKIGSKQLLKREGPEEAGVDAQELVDGVLEESFILNRIEEEQKTLVKGSVTTSEVQHRFAVASLFSEVCQYLILFFARQSLDDTYLLNELNKVRSQAERILRENPVLQADSPLCVVHSYQMPPRYSLNYDGERELRKGFGLHRRRRNDEGLSVVIAFMPTHYEQIFHRHSVHEYTLIVDSPSRGIYVQSSLRELKACQNEILCFGPHTTHTIANPSPNISKNLTVKYPLGMNTWTPVYALDNMREGFGKVLRPELVEESTEGVTKTFVVKDELHDYSVETRTLYPNALITGKPSLDKYLFVLKGRAVLSDGCYVDFATENELIVIDAHTEFKLYSGNEGVVLYEVSN